MLRYCELKENWQHCLTITGVVPAEFEQYLPSFSTTYAALYPQWQAGGDSEEPLAQMADKLLFIWLYHKMQRSPPALSGQFDLNLAETHEWIAHLSPVWQLTLDDLTRGNLSINCLHFLQLLNLHQVEYLIVGGYAVAFHGYQRPLLDLDIFINTDVQNAQKLVEVLHVFGQGFEFGHHDELQALACFQMQERVIRLGHPPFTIQPVAANERMIAIGTPPKQLEILTAISAVTFTECYPARVMGFIQDVPVPIISLSQLKRNKQASIRQKDADDLAHLP